MKKLSLLILIAVACLTLSGTATADVEFVAPGFNVDQVSMLQMLGYDTPSWLTQTELRPVPTPEPTHDDFPLTCSDYNNSFCSYQYDGGCCCVGTATVPGALCTNVCV
ncbi:MAG: hypothetical protein AAFY88_10835 [Acidobacteriota bacterium]